MWHSTGHPFSPVCHRPPSACMFPHRLHAAFLLTSISASCSSLLSPVQCLICCIWDWTPSESCWPQATHSVLPGQPCWYMPQLLTLPPLLHSLPPAAASVLDLWHGSRHLPSLVCRRQHVRCRCCLDHPVGVCQRGASHQRALSAVGLYRHHRQPGRGGRALSVPLGEQRRLEAGRAVKSGNINACI